MRAPLALSSFLVIVISVLAVTIQHRSMTQDLTPTATYPVTPNPAICTVEPRSVESIHTFFGTPAADPPPDRAGREGESRLIEVPTGQAVREDVEAAIVATVHELYACFNAGDLQRAFALMSDPFLRIYADEGEITAEDVAFITAEPEPVPLELQTSLLAITNVTTLNSRQVGAFVVISDPFTGPDTVYITFVRQDERWLVERVTAFSSE